jgi:hypothetical protein
MKTNLPLKNMTIDEIYNGEQATYEVPIYQRNYAWEKDEISTLIQDVYDALNNGKPTYYIGTLVSFHKGDQVYEVIDGQQRLTTINLVLRALGLTLKNKLTYRARKKSNDSIASIPKFHIDEKDTGIVNGFNYATEAIDEIVGAGVKEKFKQYFLNKVQIIHYQVPKDIDLNHYFEIMNSRGEQLEKHEIIKARLIEKLSDQDDKAKFHQLWENCSEMGVYIQQKYNNTEIFGPRHCEFHLIYDFDQLPKIKKDQGSKPIFKLLQESWEAEKEDKLDKPDTFQPVIDFSNFLLIVLKLTRMKEKDFIPQDFNLDDKDLIKEFDDLNKQGRFNEEFAKVFGYNLLKAKYFLDNYIVHHSHEEDVIDSNPWKLQQWQLEAGKKKMYLKNLEGNADEHDQLVQLLSMFEVTFTARQRKNYLFYCLFYLFGESQIDVSKYRIFLRKLADKVLKDVYLASENLNEINVPKPGAFDSMILVKNERNDHVINLESKNSEFNFNEVFGDGTQRSKGIPLFVFNYLDFILWENYSEEMKGNRIKERSAERKAFFERLGCQDFGLKIFEQFYFSRTRKSLEHYFPQANVKDTGETPSHEQINCFGNYAMIGSDANSSGSNWSPIGKRNHYLDPSGKIRQVSVASLKFIIMLQKCKDNEGKRVNGHEWTFEDIREHQKKMVEILLN